MNIFISQPFYERDAEEVMAERERIFSDFVKWNEEAKVFLSKGEYVLIDNYHKQNIPQDAGRLWCLGDSIQLMDRADLIIFAPEWYEAKGCRIEMEAANAYQIPIAFYNPATFSATQGEDY